MGTKSRFPHFISPHMFHNCHNIQNKSAFLCLVLTPTVWLDVDYLWVNRDCDNLSMCAWILVREFVCSSLICTLEEGQYFLFNISKYDRN